MASSRHCRECLRLLRQQKLHLRLVHPFSHFAPFSNMAQANSLSIQTNNHKTSQPFSSSLVFAQTAAASSPQSQTKSTTKSSEPKPYRPKGIEVPIDGPSTSTTQKIAIEARKRLPSVTETYVAYGVTEKLVKECGRQAAYSIPQRNEKDAAIPKTKDGEDLGVGSGWWYEGMSMYFLFIIR